MGKVKCPGPKTRGQLVVEKLFVGCKCHNHDAFKKYFDSDRIYKTTSHDFKELQRLKENGHFSKGSYVCAGCLAYARTHLKTKLQKK